MTYVFPTFREKQGLLTPKPEEKPASFPFPKLQIIKKTGKFFFNLDLLNNGYKPERKTGSLSSLKLQIIKRKRQVFLPNLAKKNKIKYP